MRKVSICEWIVVFGHVTKSQIDEETIKCLGSLAAEKDTEVLKSYRTYTYYSIGLKKTKNQRIMH